MLKAHRRRFRRNSPVLLALLLVPLVATACSKGGKTGSEGPGPTKSSSTTVVASSSTTTTVCVPTGGGTAERKAEASVAMLLTGLRVAQHGCQDRVVFELRPQEGTGGRLGYSIRYGSPPFAEDGSGKVVEVAGEAHLVVRITGSGVDLSKEGAPRTYTGPTTIDPEGLAHIRQLRRTGDYEGVLTWIIGLDSTLPYSVDVLSGPTRLVIDVG